jgi:hypothetical protein
MTDDPRDALARLLDAILECGSYVELERGADEGGPVVRAYQALGRPLPDELQSWLQLGPGGGPTEPARQHG